MNVNYINPFLEASSNVIKMVLEVQMNLGKPYLREVPFSVSGVLTIVGITGKVKGKAMLCVEEKFACKIATIMMGREISVMDELAKSALGELANMILGNTATIYFRKGYPIDITPPNILSGENIEVTNIKQQTVCIPMLFGDNGEKIELFVSFVEE